MVVGGRAVEGHVHARGVAQARGVVPPAWLPWFAGGCQFAYNTLDSIDGKQVARERVCVCRHHHHC